MGVGGGLEGTLNRAEEAGSHHSGSMNPKILENCCQVFSISQTHSLPDFSKSFHELADLCPD